LAKVMARFGLQDKWGYRFPWQSQWHGISGDRWNELCHSVDLLINVSGCLASPQRYRRVPRLVYIDSDPVFTQVKLARGQQEFRRLVELHDVHFSFGEAMRSAPVPATGYDWRPTRQPIVMQQWRPRASYREVFTTIMNWTSYKTLSYQGQSFGQKDIEFKRFIDLPQYVPDVQLEVAVNAGKTRHAPRDLLRRRGWQVVDPEQQCADLDAYRAYIETSKAEWSVAKNAYVKGRSGWFSCRSACYLAAGRPVIVQDTGFATILPVGEGILSFSTPEEAIESIQEIQTHYNRHQSAARAIAECYFDSDKVLNRLIEDACVAE